MNNSPLFGRRSEQLGQPLTILVSVVRFSSSHVYSPEMSPSNSWIPLFDIPETEQEVENKPFFVLNHN
jgi:hypothetical protein